MPTIKTEDFNWVMARVTAPVATVHKLGMRSFNDPSGPDKQCAKCRDDFPATLEFFYEDHRTADGLTRWCKACQVEWRYKRHADQTTAGA